MYFPRCFFIRSVENIIATFSEFLFQYFRFFVSFLLSSLDVNIVLLNFKETTLKYSPRQNFVFDLESINWCDQIVEELSLIQSRIIVTEKLMIIPLLTTVLYVGKTIVIRNAQIHKNTQKDKSCEWEMFLFFYLPTARPDRSAARQPMLQSFPRAPWLPRNHAPPVGGAAKQPLLQTIPGPTLEVAFRVSIGCKCKTRTKVFPGKWKKCEKDSLKVQPTFFSQ